MISLQYQVKLFQTYLDKECPWTATNVDVTFIPEFREIVVTGDGFLVMKGILNEKGTHVKITSCSAYKEATWLKKIDLPKSVYRKNGGIVRDRSVLICDSFVVPPITFNRFKKLCIGYKQSWVYKHSCKSFMSA